MQHDTFHGIVKHDNIVRKNDYLYRISIKTLIQRADGCVLVVKEGSRTWWDLPGGGMDHGEDIRHTIARELNEEVNFNGDFSYRIIAVDEPKTLSSAKIWQLRLIFEVIPSEINFQAGDDCEEIDFIDPNTLRDSTNLVERRIYEYSQLL